MKKSTELKISAAILCSCEWLAWVSDKGEYIATFLLSITVCVVGSSICGCIEDLAKSKGENK
tara:strand:- start:354 stop:539 length:186 start_codon:yes stop_codon:yes gene_type:complete